MNYKNLPPTSPGYELLYEEQCMAKAQHMLDRISCSGDSTLFLLFFLIVGALFLEYIYLHRRRKKATHHVHHKHKK